MTGHEHKWPVTCSDCGVSRAGLDDVSPCSSCGSTSQTVHVSLQDEAGAAEFSDISLIYDKQRLWREKWDQAKAAYEALKTVYGGGHPSSAADEWKAIALSFFRECHELPQAIESDSGLSQAIKDAINRAASGSTVFKLVADIDNTRKHAGRDPGKCHAHIAKISWGDTTTPMMAIERRCPNKPFEQHDVLDSATAALDKWRIILARCGLAL